MKKKFRSPQTKIVYPKAKKVKPRTPRRMSRREKIQLWSLLFLFVSGGALVTELSIMKHVVHEHANLQAVDVNTMTMKLIMENEIEPKMLQWKEDTEFMIETTEVAPTALKPSMHIIVWKKDSLFFSDNIFKMTASPLNDLDCSNPESNKESCSVK